MCLKTDFWATMWIESLPVDELLSWTTSKLPPKCAQTSDIPYTVLVSRDPYFMAYEIIPIQVGSIIWSLITAQMQKKRRKTYRHLSEDKLAYHLVISSSITFCFSWFKCLTASSTTFWDHAKVSAWWWQLKYFLCSSLLGGRFPFWLIFFRWVETTN